MSCWGEFACSSFAFLHGRKSGSTAALPRLFLECWGGLLGHRFSLFSAPLSDSEGEHAASSRGKVPGSPVAGSMVVSAVEFGGSHAVVSVSVVAWAAWYMSRADFITRVSRRLRCRRRPPRWVRELYSFPKATTMILLASVLTSMSLLVLKVVPDKQPAGEKVCRFSPSPLTSHRDTTQPGPGCTTSTYHLADVTCPQTSYESAPPTGLISSLLSWNSPATTGEAAVVISISRDITVLIPDVFTFPKYKHQYHNDNTPLQVLGYYQQSLLWVWRVKAPILQ